MANLEHTNISSMAASERWAFGATAAGWSWAAGIALVLIGSQMPGLDYFYFGLAIYLGATTLGALIAVSSCRQASRLNPGGKTRAMRWARASVMVSCVHLSLVVIGVARWGGEILGWLGAAGMAKC